MKKLIITYTTLTILLLVACFQLKSGRFNHPYPNIIEYLATSLLLLFTLVWIIWRKRRTQKLIVGGISMLSLFLVINLFNYLYEWHPIALKLPLSNSQSVTVNHTPYQWPKAQPATLGYDLTKWDEYFQKLKDWKRLRGLLVIQDDHIIAEKYFKGTRPTDAFNVHSITKTVTSALTGIAIDQGKINADEAPVGQFFPAYASQFTHQQKQLKVKHLLSMRGGFAGWDGYQTVKTSLIKEGVNQQPGTFFKYYTGASNILSAIITKTTQQSTKAFAQQHLFEPLGIQPAFWRKQAGYYCGGGESYYTPRDLARIGQLYLHQGKLNNRQIISTDWVKKSLTNYTDSSKFFRKLGDYTEVGYGYNWWILDYKDHIMYTARGKGGQYLMLLPEKNAIVVVFQEWNLQKQFKKENRLLCDLLALIYGNDQERLALKEPEKN
ncbi:MAG TPA: hypothetical protein DCS93_38090 [Microscillaceae bacterium]|nr:hypothetical protein [Microscillaceae bacterium]